MSFHKDSFHQPIGKFNKKLHTDRGEISFHADYDNNYLYITIDKYEYYAEGGSDPIIHTPIFEGRISLQTELDESGEIVLPDWIRVISKRKESEYHKRHGDVERK